MKNLTHAILLALFSVWAISLADAHEDFRTVGVIEKRILEDGALNHLQVRPLGGGMVTFWVNQRTDISKDGEKVTEADLSVGTTVVIDSYGDAYDYSEALSVRIVPPIPADGAN